jgi:hypothetical protein
MVTSLEMPTLQHDSNDDNEDNTKWSAPKIYVARQTKTNVNVFFISWLNDVRVAICKSYGKSKRAMVNRSAWWIWRWWQYFKSSAPKIYTARQNITNVYVFLIQWLNDVRFLNRETNGRSKRAMVNCHGDWLTRKTMIMQVVPRTTNIYRQT